MAAFDPDRDADDPGFRLARDSFVTLFRTEPALQGTLAQLAGHGYHVIGVDTGCDGTATLVDRFALALGFPADAGHTLDALDDGLARLAARRDGPAASYAGLVIVAHRFEVFAQARPEAAHTVLDILARRARTAALFGQRLLCLVRHDGPQPDFGPVGGMPVVLAD